MLTRTATSAIVASLLFACGAAPAPAPRQPHDAGYLVIQPDVSVSRNARPAIAKNVAVDERADIMAEILAIPPGR